MHPIEEFHSKDAWVVQCEYCLAEHQEKVYYLYEAMFDPSFETLVTFDSVCPHCERWSRMLLLRKA